MQKSKWNLEKIKEGIDRFLNDNGRYPTVRDFDKAAYLPTARTIQRTYGGVPALRELLTPESPKNFTQGPTRSNVAKNTKAMSYKHEEEFYNFLIGKFPEVKVHEQKRLRPGNIATDFFIYTTPNRGFAIDIFYSSDRFNTIGIINNKTKRYKGLPMPIIFIVIGDFDQAGIESMLAAKKNKLDRNIFLYTEKYFKSNLETIIKTLAV